MENLNTFTGYIVYQYSEKQRFYDLVSDIVRIEQYPHCLTVETTETTLFYPVFSYLTMKQPETLALRHVHGNDAINERRKAVKEEIKYLNYVYQGFYYFKFNADQNLIIDSYCEYKPGSQDYYNVKEMLEEIAYKYNVKIG